MTPALQVVHVTNIRRPPTESWTPRKNLEGRNSWNLELAETLGNSCREEILGRLSLKAVGKDSRVWTPRSKAVPRTRSN